MERCKCHPHQTSWEIGLKADDWDHGKNRLTVNCQKPDCEASLVGGFLSNALIR
ncbi:hypothetical protein SLEP1_g43435 [Rubroshorea leprosula]|uniref:Uncharacterized protein n=1 Tax=Rubroshorea leprosula TaxID=152421 RepID=A0AAV5LDR4_9ROSI|nr:hypothetical protein SLEP1_g43435 [Rubroshorea leprosula]